jgi:hypothetical protein
MTRGTIDMTRVGNLASFYFRNVVREPESGRPGQGSAVSWFSDTNVFLLRCVS